MDPPSDGGRVIEITEIDYINNRVNDETRTIHPMTLSPSRPEDINLSQLTTSNNSSSSHNEYTTSHHINPSSSATSTPTTTGVLLYHDQQINYVLEDYCQPVSYSFDQANDFCNFSRNCIVSKSKVLLKGSVVES